MSDAPVLPEPEAPEADEPAPQVIEATATEVVTPEAEPEPEPTVHLPAVARPTPLVPGRDISIIPAQDEMRGLAAMAVTLAGAHAVPKPLQNQPNDVFQVLLTARDLGVAVTTAMREFHVIDGRVTLSPKVKLAMVHERGQRDGWKVWPCSPELDPATGEKKPCKVCGSLTGNTAERAAWHASRADHGHSVFTSEFTIEMAERVIISAGGRTLAQKDNWVSYPQRMLSWRALGYLLDDVFPEVGTGLYSPDELGAMTDEDGVAIIDVNTADPLPGTKSPRGHRSASQPPNPNDLPLKETDAEAYQALRDRIDALPADGQTALKQLWLAKLPPLHDLLTREKRTADALLRSIEQRAAKGEWGPPPDDGATAAPETPPEPDGGDGGDAAPDAQEPSSDDQGPACEACGSTDDNHDQALHDMADAVNAAKATRPAPTLTREQVEQQVVAAVAAMSAVDVLNAAQELADAAGIEVPKAKQARLNMVADHLVAERLAELGLTDDSPTSGDGTTPPLTDPA